ncbi:tumor necrosis factor receptor superfamily member 10B-like isoform X2 [Ahaetulla prasina]|uniref:tumor necrosis factor receptor superfamily member 10B-like isoform X2 n=1 Tax=Ahaetulla prasina TaxID=499056 RepID=UPI002647C756|nr:tumor necrosis factor receptor superfamily member 10B-like isoform X2 [Ahaetulla prasina]
MRAQFLLTFCILAYLPHEAILARLPQTQDPRTADDDTKQFYAVYANHECRKCPPGTFVLSPCTVPRTEGICQPCENNTFSKLWNSFPSCFRCRACRILDEVEIKKCTATTNTKCACKNGSFCSPGQPCEICTKCMTSCGPGEKKVRDCTPISDIQCVPDTTSSPPTDSPGQEDPLVWPFVLLVVVAVLVLGLVVLWWCWRKNTTFRNACIGFWSNKEGQEHAEMRKLVPRNRDNSANTLSQSFDVFISKVPSKEWRRFMRLLKLTDNEIDAAENSLHYMNDKHYQMLRTWLDKNGQAATLNVLLEVLRDMDLKGVAEEITSILVAQRLYVYEE